MSTHTVLPLFVDDYEAETTHLTVEEDGVYSRLLRLCWRFDGELGNLTWLAAQVGASRHRVKAILEEFFERRGDYWRSPALDRWIERYSAPERRRRGLPAEVRAFIIERDNSTCRYCGAREGPFHVDHVQPVSRGGSDAVANLVCACRPCNLSKGAKTLDEWGAA